MGLRIGFDCDGVLRDFIPDLIESIKITHPEHADKILTPESWDWEQWLPFWTNDETEKYVFEDNYLDYFGPVCSPIKTSVEDWKKLKAWAIENDHELVLVSAQRPHCEEPTTAWLKKYGFDFDMWGRGEALQFWSTKYQIKGENISKYFYSIDSVTTLS